uniref:Uncharacterized protein n=1 Tax=Panagrolaimus superbus TaxID=310955 RepID=A0A914YDL4_9BILA
MDDPGPTASDIVHFKASQQLLNPNEEPPPKRSKTNPVQDLARKHIRIAKKIDLNVDDIILRLTADFTPPIKAAVAGQTIEIVKALFVQTGYDTKRFLDIFFKEGDCELINDADESLRYLMTKLVLIIRSKGRSSMKFADVSICRRDDDTNNLCLVFGHHDLPKFKFQMIDIIQTLPTKIHGSESFELLKEKAKITTRAQRDTKLKEKKLNAKKSATKKLKMMMRIKRKN